MKTRHTAKQRDRLRALADFAGSFAAPGFVFSTRHQPPPDESGVFEFPYFILNQEASAFVKAAYQFEWVHSGNWTGWRASDEGKRLTAGPEQISTATEEQLANLLTVIIRSDRFHEGALEAAFKRGFLTAIVQWADALLGPEIHSV